ncbi:MULTISPECIES: phospholipase A2 [unclassified Streptomyces]|uniref:phospholipase A2 n=1 Tax=unclassified Streptomyces TaxID=2593676 RepID=UPI00068ABAA9|nr:MULTISPECIES: phospholipase A2 [unclassified Streptomyces]
MTKLRTTLSAIALSGAVLAVGAAPALADSAPGGSVSPSVTASLTKAQKLSKLKNLTEDSNASTGRWLDAMNQHMAHKQAIEKYKFNWKTDYCTDSPDTLPGGYDFKMACWRHDFGYRNYKGLIGNYYFKKNGHKKRVDKALLRDLYSACDYKPWADPLPASERKRLRAACRKTAEKYYGAVSAAG